MTRAAAERWEYLSGATTVELESGTSGAASSERFQAPIRLADCAVMTVSVEKVGRLSGVLTRGESAAPTFVREQECSNRFPARRCGKDLALQTNWPSSS
jgi:hypothetical protein